MNRSEIFLDAKAFKEVFQSERNAYILNIKDSEVKKITNTRIILGIEKLNEFIDFSEIRPSMCIMNIFSGPCGLLKLLAMMEPKLLIGLDKHYPNVELSQEWVFDTKSSIDSWSKALKSYGIYKSIKTPLCLWNDVNIEGLSPLNGVFDRILIDPPFGEASAGFLDINCDAANQLLDKSLYHAKDYLAPGGLISIICPNYFYNSKLVDDLGLHVKEKVLIGGALNLTMVKLYGIVE